MLNQNHFLKV